MRSNREEGALRELWNKQNDARKGKCWGGSEIQRGDVENSNATNKLALAFSLLEK